MLYRAAEAIPGYPTSFLVSRSLACSVLCLVSVACGESAMAVDEEEIENPCNSTVAISLGQSRAGQLTSTDCLQADGAYGDRWSLGLSSAGDVRIDLTSNAFDAFLELRDNVGNVIAVNDDAGSLNSRIIQPLQAGSYIILARSLGPGETGSYQLSVVEGPDCSALGNLALGVTVTGALESSDCLFDFGGFMDNWSLNLTTPQKLRFDLKSSDFDEVILVRDQFGNIVNGADGYGPAGYARLEAELPAGDWTISVTSIMGTATGDYDLTVDVAPPCTPGTEIVLGETMEGEIAQLSCLFDGYMPADSFALNIVEDLPISIHLKSADFEPFVILRNQNGIDVAIGFDEGQTGSAYINMSLASGSYALFATGFTSQGGFAQGSYQLTVSEIVCSDPQVIDFGQTVNGTLDASDCLRVGGAFQESWRLVLANDLTARIDLESNAFDPFLELRDDVGNVIATNDDGGAGLNSRIELALAAGTYEIVATSFASGQTGAYQLTVAAPPTASVVAPTYDTSESSAKARPDSASVSARLEIIRSEYVRRVLPWLEKRGTKGLWF